MNIQFTIFAFLNSEVTELIFTKLLQDIEALVPLLICAFIE